MAIKKAVKAVKKTTKLNKKGILQLADDLVAHKKQYDQEVFGRVDDCGTFACMAGLCKWREVGTKAFKKLAKNWIMPSDGIFECKDAGCAALGIKVKLDYPGQTKLGEIFSNIFDWPDDLQEEYESNGPTWRVIAALKALQRLRVDGTIDRDPKAVHTKLPQLTKMLATAKKAKVSG